MIEKFLKYFDVVYFVRFLLLFLGLYYCHIIFNGVVSKEGNYYSPFLDDHLNYLRWLTFSILRMAGLILQGFGIDSSIEGSQVLKSASGLGINLWLPCLGLGITSFWMAFIVSQKTSLTKKFTWCAGGIAAIWFVNCWRIALLLISLDFEWEKSQFIDHHGIFNIVAYGLVVALILMFNRKSKLKKQTNREFKNA